MKCAVLPVVMMVCMAAACHTERLPAYYFKCKINGNEYIPDRCTNCRTVDFFGDTLLLVGAGRGGESMAFDALDYPLNERTYTISAKRRIGGGAAYYDNTIGSPSDIFKTDSVRTGRLIISSIDRVNKVVEGTFSFDAYNPLQDKLVNVTEGKFRLSYNTY